MRSPLFEFTLQFAILVAATAVSAQHTMTQHVVRTYYAAAGCTGALSNVTGITKIRSNPEHGDVGKCVLDIVGSGSSKITACTGGRVFMQSYSDAACATAVAGGLQNATIGCTDTGVPPIVSYKVACSGAAKVAVSVVVAILMLALGLL